MASAFPSYCWLLSTLLLLGNAMSARRKPLPTQAFSLLSCYRLFVHLGSCTRAGENSTYDVQGFSSCAYQGRRQPRTSDRGADVLDSDTTRRSLAHDAKMLAAVRSSVSQLLCRQAFFHIVMFLRCPERRKDGRMFRSLRWHEEPRVALPAQTVSSLLRCFFHVDIW